MMYTINLKNRISTMKLKCCLKMSYVLISVINANSSKSLMKPAKRNYGSCYGDYRNGYCSVECEYLGSSSSDGGDTDNETSNFSPYYYSCCTGLCNDYSYCIEQGGTTCSEANAACSAAGGSSSFLSCSCLLDSCPIRGGSGGEGNYRCE